MKAAVVVFPGSNCDRDLAVALREVAGAQVEMVWHGDNDLGTPDLIALPGGFSYGDYLRCGAMAARSAIIPAILAQAKRGVPIIGICNGFQILCEIGLLPGALMRNAGIKFECRTVPLRVEADCLYSQRYDLADVIHIPIAHHDGNFIADGQTVSRLEAEDRIAFRYCDARGNLADDANPNGSIAHIAGILSENRRILGMMPHPERAIDSIHPSQDGRALFEAIAQPVMA